MRNEPNSLYYLPPQPVTRLFYPKRAKKMMLYVRFESISPLSRLCEEERASARDDAAIYLQRKKKVYVYRCTNRRGVTVSKKKFQNRIRTHFVG